jgi:CBS domain-containing protein
MLISDILRNKGHDVVTVAPDATVRGLLATLAEHGIGATVVSADGRAVDGIVSERDIVRALADRGEGVLDEHVADIMTGDVQTCTPGAHVDELMALMTEHRVRHIPVVVDGALRGIVSIGDVVKSRMGDLELERDSLSRYISSAGG